MVYAGSWAGLERTLATNAVRAVIVDPSFGPTDSKILLDVIRRHPQVSVIAYASLDAASLLAVARISRDGPMLYETLVHERDGTTHRLAQVIERANANTLVTEVLGPLEVGLAQLPESVQRTLFDLFARPARYSSVSDLATESHVTLQTLYRGFEKARIGTPRKILTVAKVCRGYSLLRDSGVLVGAVAARLGYVRMRTFCENCSEVFGCGPSQLRVPSDQKEVALNILDWLYKPGWRKRRRVTN